MRWLLLLNLPGLVMAQNQGCFTKTWKHHKKSVISSSCPLIWRDQWPLKAEAEWHMAVFAESRTPWLWSRRHVCGIVEGILLVRNVWGVVPSFYQVYMWWDTRNTATNILVMGSMQWSCNVLYHMSSSIPYFRSQWLGFQRLYQMYFPRK